MAHLPRGLLVLLTLWLVWSRPSAASRIESPHSSPWWETEEYAGYSVSAQQFRARGDFRALETLYRQAIAHARKRGHIQAQVSYLTALGNTAALLYRYSNAIQFYGEARDLAMDSGDWASAVAVAPGLSSVHLLTGDWKAARSAVQEGLAAADRTEAVLYKPHLQLQFARLHAGSEEALNATLAAIEGARELAGGALNNQALDHLALEAHGWDLLGDQYLAQGDLGAAEHALLEAFRLRKLHVTRDLRFSYQRLGTLRLAQGRLAEAEQLTARATAAQNVTAELAAGDLLHLRGQIRQAQGHADEALMDFEAAVQSVEHWRRVVPPAARTSQTAADTRLHGEVSSFVISAAARALWKGGEEWAVKALAAVERNRAASLRHSQDLAPVWRQRLPAEYWKTLQELRSEEARLFVSPDGSARLEALHLRLSEMEMAARLGTVAEGSGSTHPGDVVRRMQQDLGSSELLLSFFPAEPQSFLWAVTRGSVHLYRLPGRREIEGLTWRFAQEIRSGANTAPATGERLYSLLFGQLSADESAKEDWVMSLEGGLFDLPFAALRTGGEYLVERHSLRTIPSAMMLEPGSARPAGDLVGLGDPIYNSADPRLRPGLWIPLLPVARGRRELNRLVASAAEIEQSARGWAGPVQLLTGVKASRGSLLETLRSAAHQVGLLHLATHVVVDSNAEGYLALSLGNDREPELLGSSEIATLEMPGSLVVMTGCASGTGEVLPGAGLLGLTRAWLSAGASGVVATSWPVEDTRGGLLPAFYRQLRSNSTAQALRRGQVEMIRSGTWQAAPAYWAAFHFTGGVR